MSELGPETRAFLEEARPGDDPTDADCARVRAALAVRLAAVATAAGAGVLGAAPSPSAGSGGLAGSRLSASMGWTAKAIIAVGLLGALGGSAALVRRGGFLRDVARSPSVAPVDLASAAAPLPSATEPSTVAAEPALPSPPVTPTSPTDPVRAAGAATGAKRRPHAGGDVAAEVRLLGEAQADLRDGNAERALALLDEHALRYPKGALGEEREAARIVALCALGREAEARVAADRFLRKTPDSPHAGPVRASCGGTLRSGAPF